MDLHRSAVGGLVKFILTILILLFACPANAQMLEGIVGGGVAAAGTYYYSGDGEPYGTNSVENNANVWGAPVIVTTAGTATTIGFYLVSTGTATQCYIALFSSTGDTKYAGATASSISIGWNDVVISQAVSSATTYEVWAECDNGNTVTYDTSCTGWWRPKAWVDWPTTTQLTSRNADTNVCKGARIKVE
jgi:hypothetical protein